MKIGFAEGSHASKTENGFARMANSTEKDENDS
jgi:hypothetical protein